MSYRTSLFIDKLSFTYAVSPSDENSIIEEANEMANAGFLYRKSRYGDLLKNYRHAFGMEFGGNEGLIVQIGPRVPTIIVGGREVRRRFMRLEWNPAKAIAVAPNAPGMVSSLLSRLSPAISTESMVRTLRVTRVDLAFDIFGEPIDNIGVSGLLRKAYSGRYEFSPLGGLNAIEIGKKENSRYLRVYDKLAEMRSRSQDEHHPIYIRTGNVFRRIQSRTRFELQLHKIGDLATLTRMKNPFAGFTVRTLHSLASGLSTHVESWMLDSCRRRGMQAALALIEDRRERAAYSRKILACEPPVWWDADAIWSEVPAALVAAFAPA